METLELKQTLDSLLGAVREAKAQGEREQKMFGTMLTETKEKLEALQKQTDEIDKKMVDAHRGGVSGKSLIDLLKDDDSVQRVMRDRKGTAVLTLKGADVALLEQRTAIDSAAVGSMTSGVLRIDRSGGGAGVLHVVVSRW